MTAKILWTTLILMAAAPVFGQNQSPDQAFLEPENTLPFEQCASDHIHEQRMQTNPAYRAEQETREAQLDQLVRQYNMGLIPKDNEIYTIPVVVHVIHDGDAYGTGSNISDEQIYSAINGLNQDFRKMAGTNGDGAGADIGVEFCLAQRDPDGNPTSGITRTNGCSVPNYCSQGITAGNGMGASETAVKNLSRWPNQQYYNIWVVTEIENNGGGSGIQGYAYFPTTSIVDGVVLLYNAFGTTGNLKSYTNMNRTITHEMGHAFGLFHTFQGGTCSEIDCTMQGDRVCDTPPTTLNKYCNTPACGGTQQVENYMDYTTQTCKNMFTEGQKARMRLAIQNSRPNLINSNACEPVTTLLADAAITEIYTPEANTCESIVQPLIKLENTGTNLLSNTVIKYRTEGAWQSYAWTGVLGPGQSVNVTLPEYDGGWGDRTLTVKTTQPNGGADANPGNDSMTKTYHSVQFGHTLTLNITKDVIGGHITWIMRNSDNETVASGGPYANFQNGTVETEVFCVEDGCYDFIMFDLAGNGICCENGDGHYELLDENNNILASGGSYGAQDLTNVCLSSEGSAPSADFSASQTTVCAGESVSFTNLTTGDVDSYSWKFFGGTPFTATGASPGPITYNTPGTYNVRLSATNAYGEDVTVKNNYITVTATQTWYADTDGDGHGDPDNTVNACSQPAGFVAAGDDCNDADPNDWNSCYDCLGVMNGNAVLDNCNVCDDNPNNDCVQDCAGVWGGNAVLDNCNVCDDNPNNDCVQDCAGVWGGDAVLDNCNVCDANPNNDCVQDCAGVWGGTAYYDDCGVCDADPANDCVPCDDLEINVLTVSEPTCNGSTNGSITIEVVNAIGGYTILWNTGENTETISGLNAGTYTIEVTSGECLKSREIVVAEPAVLELSVENIMFDDCTESATGSADIEIHGGTAPYEVLLNDMPVTDLALTGLAQGDYTVSLSDAHACNAILDFSIGQINCDSLASTRLLAAFCQSGAASFFENVGCIPVSNATSYRWKFEAQDPSAEIFEITTTQPWFKGDDIPELVPGLTYNVAVKGESDVLPGDYGMACSLQLQIGTGALNEAYCGNLNLYMDDEISANTIEGATQYEFRFEDALTGERFYAYTGTTICALEAVETLSLNAEYEVMVRGKYRHIWGAYGNICTIKILPVIETTALTDAYCNNLYLDAELDQLLVQPIEGAGVYELRISNSDQTDSLVIQKDQPVFPAMEIPGLSQDQTYLVRARANIEGVWTPWGESCAIAFNDPEAEKLNLLIYPNPALQREMVKMETRGDWEGMEIRICAAQGQPLMMLKRDFKSGVPQTFRITNLRPGLYIVHVRQGAQTLTKKLVIQ